MVVLRNLEVGVAKAKTAQGRVKQEGMGLGSQALESDFLVGILVSQLCQLGIPLAPSNRKPASARLICKAQHIFSTKQGVKRGSLGLVQGAGLFSSSALHSEFAASPLLSLEVVPRPDGPLRGRRRGKDVQ